MSELGPMIVEFFKSIRKRSDALIDHARKGAKVPEAKLKWGWDSLEGS